MTKTSRIPSQKIKTNQLDGHVYLITGASGSLGKAICLALAQHGATTILTGRNDKKLNALYDEVETSGYPLPAIIPFDLEQTDDDIYQQLINSIFNEFKRLDGVINAACDIGIIGPIGSQAGTSWHKTLQVNLNAAAMLSKACLPLLQRSENASITFISDSSARQSKAYWGAYGVSKVAIESFSRTLADELDSTSVVSNVFIPGPYLSAIRKKTHPGEETSTLMSAKQVAKELLQVVLSKESGQVFSLID
ncbi:MAG: short-chain dehydrogenase [Cycloclasticus sp. symbiont of Bathymodiolus heckerae]|nr:MAG: short-chain dehydrogenase [Cycloclasticus sp. symbiont of Bathymodiolus heckerae]